MKKIAYFIGIVGLVATLSSCSKTLVLSDGSNTKTIKVYGKVNVTSDENNSQYVNFVSVKGTKYHVDLSKYNCTLDNQSINTNGMSLHPTE